MDVAVTYILRDQRSSLRRWLAQALDLEALRSALRTHGAVARHDPAAFGITGALPVVACRHGGITRCTGAAHARASEERGHCCEANH